MSIGEKDDRRCTVTLRGSGKEEPGSPQEEFSCDIDIMPGLVQTGIETSDERVPASPLDSLMDVLGMDRAESSHAGCDYARIYADMARILLDRQDLHLAKRLAGFVLKIDNICVPAHRVRADVAFRTGDIGRGTAWFKKDIAP